MFLAQIKMKRYFTVGIALLLSMCIAATTEAKKPGGGPHPPTPPGDVYFDYYFGDYTSNPVGVVTDADGNNAVFGVAGTPSYELHDGHRWFLQYTEHGNPEQNELVAVRDDGQTVQLTNDPRFGIMDPYRIPPPWVPGTGDTQISFLGYDSVLDQQGVFTVPLVFDAIGTPSITPGEAPTLAWSIPKVPHQPPQAPGPNPNAISHSWSSDGTQLVYDRATESASYLVDLTEQTESYLGPGTFPSLSPDGTTVAYAIVEGLATVSVDGSGQVVLVGGGHGNHQIFNQHPLWSPDSEYIMFRHKEINLKSWKFKDDIRRVHRDGGAVVNLTDGLDDGVFPSAWRESVSMAPVPEPGSLVLLGLGFAALLGCLRRHLHCTATGAGSLTTQPRSRMGP